MNFTEMRFNRNRHTIRNLQIAIDIIRECKAEYAIQILVEEQEVLFKEGKANTERADNIKRARNTFEDISEIKKARGDLTLGLECIGKYPGRARCLSPARRILTKENERLEKEEILRKVDAEEGDIQNEQSVNDRLLDEIIRLSKKNGQLEDRIEYLENMLRAINNDEKGQSIFKRRV